MPDVQSTRERARMKSLRLFSPWSLSLLCLVLVALAWAFAWRLDDQRDHPGWRRDAVRIVAGQWLDPSLALQVRAVGRTGEIEEWPEGLVASTWQGLRARDDGGSSEESIRHEVAMVACREMLDGAEVWALPAIRGNWRASVDKYGRRAVHLWVLRNNEWHEVERWARDSWYIREAVEDRSMVDEPEQIRDLAELPPPIKPHPPSDPLSAKRPEVDQETVRS